ncbi:MAG: LacI family DNA-binding transcriptional regulator [Mesorhizobium sp.]
MAVTLANVADLAGVDRSTVSKVLAGSKDVRVREETRLRIFDAAHQLGYRPNGMARALRTNRSQTLGLVLPRLDNPVFSDMTNGVEAAARARGYSILINRISGANARDAFMHMVTANQVDGVLVISFDSDRTLEDALAGLPVPVVMINRRAVNGAGYVVHDSFRAAEMATRHLIEAGHRRILHLAGRSDGFNGSQRLAGYRAALEAAGLAFDESLVLSVGYDPELAASALANYLRTIPVGSRRPTAVFAATLVTAAGALRTLHECGFELPRDFSVVALNDGLLASLVFPQLTTVALQSAEMGSRAAAMLIDQIVEDRQPRAEVLPPGGMIVRGSVAPPPEQA